jgi:hypothetical protein
MHCGWTTRTCKGSTIRDVESEAAFSALHHTFGLPNHLIPLSLNQPLNEVLKTFLKSINTSYAEILTTLKQSNIQIEQYEKLIEKID